MKTNEVLVYSISEEKAKYDAMGISIFPELTVNICCFQAFPTNSLHYKTVPYYHLLL